jgi:hypothetical protein
MDQRDWRIIANNYASMNEAAPPRFEPQAYVYFVGDPIPIPVGLVQH